MKGWVQPFIPLGRLHDCLQYQLRAAARHRLQAPSL